MGDGQRETDALGETGLSPHPPLAVTRYREGDVLLGRFKVIRPVGRGGMGEVYEVRDLRLHARVAMKTVREPDDPGLIERLRREVQLARAVTHPNVCRVFDLHEGAGPDGGPLVFVTMEFLDGETLSGRIASAPLSPGDALPLLGQMAEGPPLESAPHWPGERPDNAPDPRAYFGAYFGADSRAISRPKRLVPQSIAGSDLQPSRPDD